MVFTSLKTPQHTTAASSPVIGSKVTSDDVAEIA